MGANARALEEGSVLVETLVALPAVTAIFASVLALSAMYGAKLEAKALARRLAWLQADSGSCPATSCDSASCRELAHQVEGALAPTGGSPRRGLSFRSFLGDVRRFFIGGVTRGVGHVHARLPRGFASGTTSQSGVMPLLCNTTTRHATSGESILDHACRAGLDSTEYAGEICR